MNKIKGNVFVGERIEADGNEFVDNVFQNCVFVISASKPFAMRNNKFHNTRVEFAGAAAETIVILRALYHGGFTPVVEEVFQRIRTPPTDPSSAASRLSKRDDG